MPEYVLLAAETSTVPVPAAMAREPAPPRAPANVVVAVLLTVKVKPAPPAWAVLGLRLVMMGASWHRAGCAALGRLYLSGQGVMRDPGRAAALLARACSAGDPESCTRLGLLYQRGEGVAKDDSEAVHWWEKAAEQGDIGGQINLGIAYHRSDLQWNALRHLEPVLHQLSHQL